MPTRSTTSEYQPSPPIGRLQRGRVIGRVYVKTTASHAGIKPNMCCPPATNGDRAEGLAPSQPASATSMKVIRTRY
jgi:hypothetical protein